jgi:ATP-dependent Clp protease ATP-binding subunit ClpC
VSFVPHSAEFGQVYEQACDIARQTDSRLSTAHILLAFFVVPNPAEQFLLSEGINEETLLALLESREREEPELAAALDSTAAALAQRAGHQQIKALHVLAGMAILESCTARTLLKRTGLGLSELHDTALLYADRGIPSELRQESLSVDPARMTAAFAALEFADDDRDTAIELPAIGEQTVQAPVLERRSVSRQNRGARVEVGDSSERRSPSPGRRNSDRTNPDGSRPDREEDEGDESDVEAQVRTTRDLSTEDFPWLCRLGRNLSAIAENDGFDPVIGRDREIEEVIDILNKRRSNNPCLIGEPGVGKTAIVEGVVTRLVQESEDNADERIFLQLDVGSLLAGTQLRGSLAERLQGLQDEVRKAAGRVVIFIDEIHTLIGAGAGDGGHDASNELKSALAQGDFPCIGATTNDEYREHVESDPALERRFTPIHVDEPDEESTVGIVRAVADRYAAHHGVVYQPEAVEAAVRLGRRYLHERRDPDRALGILDLAGAVTRRSGGEVNRRVIAEVISRTARVPVEHLMLDDPQRFLEMEDRLANVIVGQRHVLRTISETIRRNLAGFAGKRPVGSFLFLGPTGVGKTEAVKALAEFLFGSREALVRFDMSEFLESHSVARLIGAPPGYVGHQDGGQLTDRIRKRPYQVVLFDEIEKSHRDVWNVLLQVLDEGHLTDGRGRTVDFSNTVIVMTSNLGADVQEASERRIGFSEADVAAGRSDAVLDAARKTFAPELWNRIESRLVFHPLSKDEVRAIARLQVRERSALLEDERDIGFEVSDAAIELLIEMGGYDIKMGARPMRQVIARELESQLASMILAGEVIAGQRLLIDAHDGALSFESA